MRLLVHNGQNVVSTLALIDPGCETSLISKDLAAVLKLDGRRTKLKLGTFHGSDPDLSLTQTQCYISSTADRLVKILVNPLLIVPELKVSKRVINWKEHQHRWPHLKEIELTNFDWREVGLFVGANVPDALRQEDLRPSPTNSLDGIKTPFGWTVQ